MSDYTILIIRVVFTIIAILLTKYIIPILKTLYERNVNKNIKDAVKDSVEAAEQTIKGSGKGLIKKDVVVAVVTDYLEKKGYDCDAKTVDNLIEAAVYAMNVAKGKKENQNG